MKKFLFFGILALMIIFTLGCTRNYVETDGDTFQVNVDRMPYDEISEYELDALRLAISDEYKARATYQKVIDTFGPINPFSNILKSEENHVAHLIALYEKYDLTVPYDAWYTEVPAFDTIEEACQAGVQAETVNANLYDSLMGQVDNEDISLVFLLLSSASRNNHLPAFENCS